MVANGGGMRRAGFKAITYQFAKIFIKCNYVKITLSPRIAYDRMLQAAISKIIHFYFFFNLHKPHYW